MSKVFGELVRRHRLRLKMTLQEVADRVGVSKSHVWMIEQGRADPGLGLAVDIAASLRLRIKFLPFLKR